MMIPVPSVNVRVNAAVHKSSIYRVENEAYWRLPIQTCILVNEFDRNVVGEAVRGSVGEMHHDPRNPNLAPHPGLDEFLKVADWSWRSDNKSVVRIVNSSLSANWHMHVDGFLPDLPNLSKFLTKVGS